MAYWRCQKCGCEFKWKTGKQPPSCIRCGGKELRKIGSRTDKLSDIPALLF